MTPCCTAILGDTLIETDRIGSDSGLEYIFPKDVRNSVKDFLHIKKEKPPSKRKPVYNQPDPVYARALAAGHVVSQELANAGLQEPGVTMATLASYHETAAFTSPLFLDHNNGSGIKFAGQKGAVKGDNGYAWFKSPQDWANAYVHELKKGSNPAGAYSLEDFASRLKQNHYYEDSYENYLNGLKRARLALKTLPAAEMEYDPGKDYNQNTGVSTDKPAPDTAEGWWSSIPWYARAGMGIGAGLIILAAVKS